MNNNISQACALGSSGLCDPVCSSIGEGKAWSGDREICFIAGKKLSLVLKSLPTEQGEGEGRGPFRQEGEEAYPDQSWWKEDRQTISLSKDDSIRFLHFKNKNNHRLRSAHRMLEPRSRIPGIYRWLCLALFHQIRLILLYWITLLLACHCPSPFQFDQIETDAQRPWRSRLV